MFLCSIKKCGIIPKFSLFRKIYKFQELRKNMRNAISKKIVKDIVVAALVLVA